MNVLINEMKESKGNVLVSSRVVSKFFEREHRYVLHKIRNLGCSEKFRLQHFLQSSFKNAQNKTQPEYLMTRDGFSILVMGFTTKKAMKWKEEFIAAFNSMEKALLNQSNADWKQARIQGKFDRNDLTDIIHEFTDYAESQGSKNCRMYYANITKMEYKALYLIEKGEKVHKNFRDTLDRMQINALTMSEQIARHWLREGMNQGLHYKEIYQLVKLKVDEYAKTASITYQVDGKEKVLIG